LDDVPGALGEEPGLPNEELSGLPAPVAPAGMPSPSIKPALLVVSIAALILGLGMTGAAITSSHPATTAIHAPGSPAKVLARMHSLGQPPADVLDAIPLPTGTHLTATANVTHGASTYDHAAALTSYTTPEKLLAFYDSELPDQGWAILAKNAPAPRQPGVEEILAQHPSADGYYWEVALLIPTSSPAPSGASSSVATVAGGAASPGAPATSPPYDLHYHLELYEEPDPD